MMNLMTFHDPDREFALSDQARRSAMLTIVENAKTIDDARFLLEVFGLIEIRNEDI